MNKSEILNLHTLSEDKQFQWLLEKDALKSEKVSLSCNCGGWSYVTESLADCAFRLRDGVAKDTIAWNMSMTELQLLCRKLKCSMAMATPIMWIQAALLATLDSEVNDE